MVHLSPPKWIAYRSPTGIADSHESQAEKRHDSQEQNPDAEKARPTAQRKRLPALPASINLDDVPYPNQLTRRDSSNVMLSWMIKQLLHHTQLTQLKSYATLGINVESYLPDSMR